MRATADPDVDVIVVGGGPAGLSASLFLARFLRTVLLFDSGQGRSTFHQVNHNYLGFPGGIPAQELRERGLEQLREYDHVRVADNKVLAARQDGEVFTVSGQFGECTSRAVILCMGVRDHYPHFQGWEDYVGRSMFWCITCDGYAMRNRRVVVAGSTNDAATEALQLARLGADVTLLTNSAAADLDGVVRNRLQRAEVGTIEDKIATVEGDDGMLRALLTNGGRRIELDALFSVQGATPIADVAEDLGVERNAEGYLVVDADQKTRVPGVYAAGDLTRHHSHLVTAAVHEGAQAAAGANFFLYPPDLQGRLD